MSRIARWLSGKRPLVFVSYRHETPTGIKTLLYEKFVRFLPECDIFRDEQSISPATDYQAALINAVLSSRLVLALIDEEWHKRWKRDDSGSIVDDADDWVFRELQTAIHHNVRILPIVIAPSHPPVLEELPPSIAEIFTLQCVTFYPTPDFDGSALKVREAIRSILHRDEGFYAPLARRAFLAFMAVLAVTIFVWRWNQPDLTLQKEKFQKELDVVRQRRIAPVREHPTRMEIVASLGQPDLSNFSILSDDRTWDLRGFKQVDPLNPPYQSSVEHTRHLRIVKRHQASELRFEARTSGVDLILQCSSHPDRTTEFVTEAETVVGGQRLKVRQVAIDVTDIAVGDELQLTLHATYWDSLQERDEQWLGAIGYQDSDFVRMLLVFPDDKPFTSYYLQSAPSSNEPATPFRGKSLVLTDRSQTGLLWEIPKPRSGYVYRISWEW